MKIFLLSLICTFLFLQTARAEYPLLCQSQKDAVHHVLVSKPKKDAAPWVVRYFYYDSSQSKYKEDTSISCKKENPQITGTPDQILASCEIIYGPDGGVGISVKKDGTTGKITATYVAYGPTGPGTPEIMPCQEGVN